MQAEHLGSSGGKHASRHAVSRHLILVTARSDLLGPQHLQLEGQARVPVGLGCLVGGDAGAPPVRLCGTAVRRNIQRYVWRRRLVLLRGGPPGDAALDIALQIVRAA